MVTNPVLATTLGHRTRRRDQQRRKKFGAPQKILGGETPGGNLSGDRLFIASGCWAGGIGGSLIDAGLINAGTSMKSARTSLGTLTHLLGLGAALGWLGYCSFSASPAHKAKLP